MSRLDTIQYIQICLCCPFAAAGSDSSFLVGFGVLGFGALGVGFIEFSCCFDVAPFGC